MDKLTIEISRAKFKAYHGYYKEEQLIGSFFLVSLKVEYWASTEVEFHLDNTIDYQEMFHIVREEMSTPQALLENVAKNIVNQIENKFNSISRVEIGIEKCNPPIMYFNGDSVKVSLERNYETN